jgi:hypothetical protein
MIVIGLGSGRTGTASLAKLLGAQPEAFCFHEMNPSCVRYSGTPRPIINTIDEFQAIIDGGDPAALTVDLSRKVAADAYDRLCRMPRVRLIGDIAYYYLNYVEAIAAHNANVRFICLKRDREETVDSWMRKTTISRWRSKRIADRLAAMITREPYYEATNHWMEHDGTVWMPDPVWDKCFPKFAAAEKRDAIGQYWDYYYREAERLAGHLGGSFRIFETNQLNQPEGQKELLTYCGLDPENHVHADAHVHKSRT